MDDEILTRLLQIEFEHNSKIDKHEEALNADYLYIDLLTLILDAIGMPVDATELPEDHPDFFCRDYWLFGFDESVKEGTYEECKAFLESTKADLERYKAQKKR
jgi:hypothetical protein